VKGAYLKHLANLVDKEVIAAASLKIVVDPIHEAGAGYIEDFLSGICGVTAVRNHVDPLANAELPMLVTLSGMVTLAKRAMLVTL